MTGLAPQTLDVFPAIASLECVRDFSLVGGTAISLQINHRLSEDLDFCRWVDATNAKNAIPHKIIQEELDLLFDGVHVNPLSFDQIDFRVNKVKLTFFNEVGYNLPAHQTLNVGGITCMPLDILCAMKIKTLFERNVYRDYYDLYCLIKDGLIKYEDALSLAIVYQPKLTAKSIENRLTNWRKFQDEKYFSQLSPKHKVNSRDIGQFFMKLGS